MFSQLRVCFKGIQDDRFSGKARGCSKQGWTRIWTRSDSLKAHFLFFPLLFFSLSFPFAKFYEKKRINQTHVWFFNHESSIHVGDSFIIFFKTYHKKPTVFLTPLFFFFFLRLNVKRFKSPNQSKDGLLKRLFCNR